MKTMDMVIGKIPVVGRVKWLMEPGTGNKVWINGLFLALLVLLQMQNCLTPALAAGEAGFEPRVVLDGLISTCGLIILVAGGALGVRLFFNGQMVQAVVAVLIAAFVFTILNTSALTELGSGLKDFIWAGDSVTTTSR